jgi:uroporphyrin-3 C-methyltransferase/uroporphyrinogen III methyltransferase/synthase
VFEATKVVINALTSLEKKPLNFNPEVNLQSTQQVKEWAQ